MARDPGGGVPPVRLVRGATRTIGTGTPSLDSYRYSNIGLSIPMWPFSWKMHGRPGKNSSGFPEWAAAGHGGSRRC